MSMELDRINFQMLYTNSKGIVSQVATSLLEVTEVVTSSHGLESDYLITFKETRHYGYSHEFIVSFSELSGKDDVRKILYRHGFIFYHYYSEVFLVYITKKLMEFIREDQLGYYHEGLGFTQMRDGSRQFLIGDTAYQGRMSYYRDRRAKFQQGVYEDYRSFLESNILPYKATRFALTLGLSSVLASDLREFADVSTIVANLSGESSTGKTTIAQFIASLWGSPRISNRGIVRTFNATHNSMIKSFSGIHGVGIIIDDATSSLKTDFSMFLYQSAQGEDKMRMKNGSEFEESKGNWSGTILTTSEDDLTEYSSNTGGTIPRLLRLNGITWTQSAEHSKSIKRFISSNYGHLGRDFVERYLQVDRSELEQIFLNAERRILDSLTNEDQYTPRIVSRLAIITTTAELIERFYNFANYQSQEIYTMLAEIESKSSVGRALEDQALDIIKDYIVRHQYSFPHKIQVDTAGSYMYSKSSGGAKFPGYFQFTSGSEVEVTILSSVVKAILEEQGIFQWNTILKRWRSVPFIKKYGKDSKVSETDNIFKVKAITFYFNRVEGEDSLFEWYYDAEADFALKQELYPGTPVSEVHYDDDEAVEAIFTEE